MPMTDADPGPDTDRVERVVSADPGSGGRPPAAEGGSEVLLDAGDTSAGDVPSVRMGPWERRVAPWQQESGSPPASFLGTIPPDEIRAGALPGPVLGAVRSRWLAVTRAEPVSLAPDITGTGQETA